MERSFRAFAVQVVGIGGATARAVRALRVVRRSPVARGATAHDLVEKGQPAGATRAGGLS